MGVSGTLAHCCVPTPWEDWCVGDYVFWWMKSSVRLVHAHMPVIPDKYTHFSAHQPFHPRELSSWLEGRVQTAGLRQERWKRRERKKRFQRYEEHGWKWDSIQAKGQKLEAAPFQAAPPGDFCVAPVGLLPRLLSPAFTDRAPVSQTLFEDRNGPFQVFLVCFPKKRIKGRKVAPDLRLPVSLLLARILPAQCGRLVLSSWSQTPMDSIIPVCDYWTWRRWIEDAFQTGERGSWVPMALSHCRGDPWPCRWCDYFSKMIRWAMQWPQIQASFCHCFCFPENLPGLS